MLFFYTVAKFLSLDDFGNFKFLISASIFLITFLTFGLDHKLFLEVSANLKQKSKLVSSDIETCMIFINVIFFKLSY